MKKTRTYRQIQQKKAGDMMSASATIATANRASVSEQSEEQKMVKKVAVSSFLGNFIEWFDYASYSYFATTIALVLFPSGNQTVAMLQTFGVFELSLVHCFGVTSAIRGDARALLRFPSCSCRVHRS